MHSNQVKILIPIHKPLNVLAQNEIKAIEQCCAVLSDYKICFVKPESLDVSDYQEIFPKIGAESFQDKYFKSVQAYNELMLVSSFYQRFSDFEYILIYQLDAYVFKDELSAWCEKGYDYIGAPWLMKDKYYKWYNKLFLQFKSISYKVQNKPFRKFIVGDKVGNGGFSLRKVKTFFDVTVNEKHLIEHYLEKSKKHSEFNEDVFWATAVHFNRPSVTEALKFAFDQYPDICYEKNHKQLPFGCHGWSKEAKYWFWKDFIK